MDDKSNMIILKEHYHEVFNHKVNIDEKVLEHLEQRTMAQELGEPPNQQQIMVAIQKKEKEQSTRHHRSHYRYAKTPTYSSNQPPNRCNTRLLDESQL